MEFIPRKEIGWLEDDPRGGNPEVCREIRRSIMITNGLFVKRELAVADEKTGLERWW